MSRKRNGSNDDSLRLALQELVNQVGLEMGELKLVIHEGTIPYIVIRPEYRLELRDEETGITVPRDQIIRLNTAKEFVRSQLQHSIVDKTGQFGHVKVIVNNGLASNWHFTKRYKYTG